LGIPVVVGLGEALTRVGAGAWLIVDGSSGSVIVEPDVAERAEYTLRIPESRSDWETAAQDNGPPYRTADGARLTLLANASTVPEAALAVENGAEGIGVLRTEFLLSMLGAYSGGVAKAPDEDTLAAAYASVLREMGALPVVARVLDAGGDKPLPFIDFGHEANPFLGWRGIRVLLDMRELFVGQTRALLRAAAQCGTDLRILLPMISTVDEFVRARRIIDDVYSKSGLILKHPLRVGAMIEVPAAALSAVNLARVADFFSIGTNDLVQYTMAADRGNPRVAALCRPQHPAVLRLIDIVVRAAHAENKLVAVCGEAAGDPAVVPLLVGLGVDELSVSPARLPALRRQVPTLHCNRLRVLAARALQLGTADEVVSLFDSDAPS
jgi:phosphotransferase system enzyme I (PtsI)